MNEVAWLKTTSSRVAFVVLAGAVVLFGWTISRAIRADRLPDVPPTRIASIESITHHVLRPMTDVQAAVESDVFSPDRSAPGGSYRMPGESDPNVKQVETQKPVVLGTAVATDGRHFATVDLKGDGHPTLVHVGDKIGEWVVRAIERGKVTFTGPGGTRVDLPAKDALSLNDVSPRAVPAGSDDQANDDPLQQNARSIRRFARPTKPAKPPKPGT